MRVTGAGPGADAPGPRPGVRGAWRPIPYEAALARPLATARGAVAARAGWYLAFEAEGVVGLGEATAWPAWGTEDAATLAAAIAALPAEAMAPTCLAAVPGALAAIDVARTPALYAVAELALLDWLAQRYGLPLHAVLREPSPPPVRGGGGREAGGGGAPPACRVSPTPPLRGAPPLTGGAEVGVRVAALVAEEAEARAAVAAGHLAVKLKIDVTTTPEAVLAVRAAIGPAVDLRLDANGAWPDAATALPALAALAAAAPAFVEQPIPAADLAGLIALAHAAPVPVAADEALGRPGAADVAIAGRVPVLVVKPMLHGGLLRARALAAQARAAGAHVVLSSALDRGVGTAGALHLAAALAATPPAAGAPGADDPPAGLGTAGLYADGGALDGLAPVGGAIALPAAPGLGFASRDPALRALLAVRDVAHAAR